MVLQGMNLGLYFGMRMKKIKVYKFIDEGACPKYIGIMKGDDGESLTNLRMCPNEKKVLKFGFQFGI